MLFAADILDSVILYAKIFGIAPFKVTKFKVIIIRCWDVYGCCLLLCNLILLIYLSYSVLIENHIYLVIMSGYFTHFLDITLSLFTNVVLVASIMVYKNEICKILNRLNSFHVALAVSTQYRISFYRIIIFSMNVCIISLMISVGLVEWITNPFEVSKIVGHCIFFFSCEIVVVIFGCFYNGILLTIGYLYEEVITAFISWTANSSLLKRYTINRNVRCRILAPF